MQNFYEACTSYDEVAVKIVIATMSLPNEVERLPLGLGFHIVNIVLFYIKELVFRGIVSNPTFTAARLCWRDVNYK